MRVPIKKRGAGRSAAKRKEVALRINKSGKTASGKPRYVVAIRFTNESYKKASSTGFVIPEVDFEEGKLYFTSGTEKEGYKLVASGRNSTFKSITFSIDEPIIWKPYISDYDLLKDTESQDYYIDFSKK